MASSRGMKGADYSISGGRLFRHTGCQWRAGAPLDSAKFKPANAKMPAYLYVGPNEIYLLRVKDSFVNRRGSATELVAEGRLGTLWGLFLAYGKMQEAAA